MKLKRNAQLDVIRGIAILMVLGAHFKMEHPKEGVVSVVAKVWMDYGGFGVPLFFVLSGFLIGGLLLSEQTRTGTINVKRFLIRRGLKIYPIYFLFLAYLVGMPTLKALMSGADPVSIFLQRGWEVLPHLIFIQNYIGGWIAGHTWSLAVEEHFYIFLPLFLLLMHSWRCSIYLWAIMLAAPVFFTIVRLFGALLGDPYFMPGENNPEECIVFATHLRVDALLMGVGIRAWAEYYPDGFGYLKRWRYLLFVLGVGILFLPIRGKVGDVPLGAILQLNNVAACCVMIGLYHCRSSDFSGLSHTMHLIARMFAWTGVYSYSIYIWHVTVIRVIERSLGKVPWLEMSTPVVWLGAAALLCLGAVIVGFLVSAVIEQPVLLLRERYFPSPKEHRSDERGQVTASLSGCREVLSQVDTSGAQ